MYCSQLYNSRWSTLPVRAAVLLVKHRASVTSAQLSSRTLNVGVTTYEAPTLLSSHTAAILVVCF